MTFNETLLVIGGMSWEGEGNLCGGLEEVESLITKGFITDIFINAAVEYLDKMPWKEFQKMSPVHGFDELAFFSTISIGSNLFIFG